MASTVEDCDATVAAANATDSSSWWGISAFNPRYAAAKTAIAEGKIGKIVSIYPARIPAWVGFDVLQDRPDHRGRRPRYRPDAWYSERRWFRPMPNRHVRGFEHPDLWTIPLRYGAIGVLENVGSCQTNSQIRRRMNHRHRGLDPYPRGAQLLRLHQGWLDAGYYLMVVLHGARANFARRAGLLRQLRGPGRAASVDIP